MNEQQEHDCRSKEVKLYQLVAALFAFWWARWEKNRRVLRMALPAQFRISQRISWLSLRPSDGRRATTMAESSQSVPTRPYRPFVPRPFGGMTECLSVPG